MRNPGSLLGAVRDWLAVGPIVIDLADLAVLSGGIAGAFLVARSLIREARRRDSPSATCSARSAPDGRPPPAGEARDVRRHGHGAGSQRTASGSSSTSESTRMRCTVMTIAGFAPDSAVKTAICEMPPGEAASSAVGASIAPNR